MADETPGEGGQASTAVHGFAPGTVLEGKYRLDRVIGSGGMGIVYAGTHLLLDKPVAVKLLLPELAASRDVVDRMIREARTASATGHPNVVAVSDLGLAGAAPFIVMELLEGRSLERILQEDGPLPLADAARIMMEVLDALEAVHERGIVHRDLKPANVMLARGPKGRRVAKVLDFGISKVLAPEADTAATKTGRVMGTPRHMAPEQALAKPIDHRCDIHAAGSLLYALLTGAAPFQASSATATLARLLEGSYTPASRIVPGLPAALDDVIARALAPEPENRFADAEQMRAALRPFTERVVAPGSTVGPPPVALDGPPTAGALRSGADVDPWPTRARASVPAAGDPASSRLELDVPAGWRAGQNDRSPIARSRPRGNRFAWWGWYALVAAVVAGAWAAWRYRADLVQVIDVGDLGGGATPSGETILLLVDTVPKDALVFIDDVQRDERPVTLPKSDAHVKIRVQAPGYEPRVLQIQPTRTRRVKIELDRTPRKRKKTK
jgi:serine/threonine-protein kinase